MTDDLIAALGSVPLFEGLSQKELKAVAAVGTEIDRAVGDVIAAEGSPGLAFFAVLDGAADVTVGGISQRTMRPGDHFGEIALIDDGARTATVTVTEPARVFALTPRNFKPLLEEYPGMTEKLLLGLCKMIRFQQT
jgi:CRP-like cAMP-binding protein